MVRVRVFIEVALLLEEIVVGLMEEVVVVAAVVVVDVLAVVMQIRPGEPSNIASLFAVEVSHAPQSVCAKDGASLNM